MPRIFLFGDNVDTDQLAPGRYMRAGLAELAAHCLEVVRPDFAASVRPGDVVAAGRNFGAGSSREQAAEALRHLGVAAVIARSFAGIFYRNAINLGLPVLVARELDAIRDGDPCRFDLEGATLWVGERALALEPVPENLRPLLADGGLVPHLARRFRADRR